MISDPLRVALQVAQIFESLEIPYLVGGALASAVLGEPRATEDIDIVADDWIARTWRSGRTRQVWPIS